MTQKKNKKIIRREEDETTDGGDHETNPVFHSIPSRLSPHVAESCSSQDITCHTSHVANGLLTQDRFVPKLPAIHAQLLTPYLPALKNKSQVHEVVLHAIS